MQLNQYDINSQMMPFEDWTVGENLFNTLDREHDLLDRDFRAFAEECDQLKGIQIFTGADDAWGGFAARYIDRLRDEFGKKNMWTWALDGGVKADRVCHPVNGNLYARIADKDWLNRQRSFFEKRIPRNLSPRYHPNPLHTFRSQRFLQKCHLM